MNVLNFLRKPQRTGERISRQALVALLAVGLTQAATAQSPAEAACRVQSGVTVPAIVELYTSEGCNSCPPADRWLASIVRNTPSNVIALAFHVDYWDYIGWKDIYAKPAYGERHRKLVLAAGSTTVYTPQVFVNGRDDRSWHHGAVPRASLAARANLAIESDWSPNRVKLRGQVSEAREPLRIRYALTENSITTAVKAGENKGELLTHDAVVREHAYVAVDASGAFGADIILPAKLARARSQLHVIAETRSGEAVAAASLRCAG